MSTDSDTTLLEARGVGVVYPHAKNTALSPTQLRVGANSLIGVVGESGSGKTTLARALVGLLRPTVGEVLVNGVPWTAVGRGDQRRRSVQMIFQDPYGSLNPRLSARQSVAEVLQVWDGLGARESLSRAGVVLSEVGLSEDSFDRRPQRLSGGQCQRVGIARALAARPRVLIADEPTSSLDVSVQAQILNMIVGLSESHGLSLVLISHDLGVVRYVTRQVFVMYAGHVVEQGPTSEVFAAPAHPYTRALLDSIPGRAPIGPPLLKRPASATGCVFAASCPRAQAECAVAQPDLRATDARKVACLFPLDENSGGVK